MTRLVAFLTLALASSAFAAKRAPKVAAADADAIPAASTASANRVPMPTNLPLAVDIDALGKRITITSKQNLKPVVQKLQQYLSTPCKELEQKAHSIVVHCNTTRIDASLVSQNGKLYLDVRELRGIPTRAGSDDSPPATFYDPGVMLGFGGRCPGVTPAGKAECALKAGKREEAQAGFEQALTSALDDFAAMRLGDLAVEQGDITRAVSLYKKAGSQGPWGRMSQVRTCELMGICYNAPDRFSFVYLDEGLTEPLRTEMEMRRARATAFLGNYGLAIDLLRKRKDARDRDRRPPVCDENDRLCRRIALAALEAAVADENLRDTALTFYLDLPRRNSGPLSVELAAAAATIAGKRGAPKFAANLLAVTTDNVPPDALDDHLLRMAEFYAQASDHPHTEAIYDYARSRGSFAKGNRGRWLAISHYIDLDKPKDSVVDVQKARTEDFKSMQAEIIKAADVTAKAKTVLQGDKAK